MVANVPRGGNARGNPTPPPPNKTLLPGLGSLSAPEEGLPGKRNSYMTYCHYGKLRKERDNTSTAEKENTARRENAGGRKKRTSEKKSTLALKALSDEIEN